MVAPSKLFPSAWSSSFTLLPANSRLTSQYSHAPPPNNSCHQVVTFKVPGNVKNAVNACLQHHKYIFPVAAVTKRLQVELPF
ncbi:hypothetical protein B0H16DRAFT_1713000 [Mycena metata]|uniref:Uncharacterized protein n=1 Tax=Mycena metata TaxID=1033252 RepID=A0AAD7JZW9_9AGAR|nr:hypothetical protein B0H16DRAFT_1713000 [Mycena metata]